MILRLSSFLLGLTLLSFCFGNVALAQGAPSTAGGDPTAPDTPDAIQPTLQVPIPGFSGDTVVIGDGNNGCDEGMVCAFTLDAYLNAVYRWAAGASVLLAIVLIMVGGVEYMIGSAAGSIDRAKGRMRNASFGLLLVFCTTAILSFVNPDITRIRAVRLPIIEQAEDIDPQTILGGVEVETNLVPPGIEPGPGQVVAVSDFSHEPYFRHGSDLIHPDIVPLLHQVGEALHQATGGKHHLRLSDGYRSTDSQAATWLAKCFKGNRTVEFSCDIPVCNPFPRSNAESPFDASNHTSGPFQLKSSISQEYEDDGALVTYLRQEAVNNTRAACPHLTGTTVDIWCGPYTASYVDVVDCHIKMEELMNQAGFKRLDSETWHFEHSSKLVASSTRAGGRAPGTQRITPKQCRASRHGPSCEFDYTTCLPSNNGSNYANFKKCCCSDATGTCCDTASANASQCAGNSIGN